MTSEKSQSGDVQRLAALSDGIFAVAMTLLAYNVHVPNAPLNDRQLGFELVRMLNEGSGLLMSFAVAAMFWMSHFQLFRSIQQADSIFGLINFGQLFSIVLLPISTSFYFSFGSNKAAAVTYGANLALLSALNILLWVYAVRKRWLPGFDPRFPGILLDLTPGVYSLLLFLGGLAVIPWRPAAAQVFWITAFGAPLVRRLVDALRARRGHRNPE
ncbi:MAG: DUF1211 domain-containing protein [Verrucomicrobia bacterium]|nr:DUF1211 domain-containing protein [Verrucomicrobiota bacterium]